MFALRMMRNSKAPCVVKTQCWNFSGEHEDRAYSLLCRIKWLSAGTYRTRQGNSAPINGRREQLSASQKGMYRGVNSVNIVYSPWNRLNYLSLFPTNRTYCINHTFKSLRSTNYYMFRLSLDNLRKSFKHILFSFVKKNSPHISSA
jgi:hypothetical protein